jgi:hypothetical protein
LMEAGDVSPKAMLTALQAAMARQSVLAKSTR